METPHVITHPRALLALARLWPEGKPYSTSKFWIKFCLNSVSRGASRSSPEGPHGYSDQCPVTVPIQKLNKVHCYPWSMLKPAAFTAPVSLRSSLREMPVLIRTASLHRHSFTASISQVKTLEHKLWIKCLVILGPGSKYARLSRPWTNLSAKCFPVCKAASCVTFPSFLKKEALWITDGKWHDQFCF